MIEFSTEGVTGLRQTHQTAWINGKLVDLQIIVCPDVESFELLSFGLTELHREAQNWASADPALADVIRRLEGLRAETQDLAETLRDLSQRWEANPARREEVEERLHLLRRLEAKYGRSIDELLAYRATLDEQASRWQQQEEDRSQLESDLAQTFA